MTLIIQKRYTCRLMNVGHGAREGVTHWGSLKGNWKYKKRNIRKLSKLTQLSQITCILLKFGQRRRYVQLDRFIFKQFQLSRFGYPTCSTYIYITLFNRVGHGTWKCLINASYWNKYNLKKPFDNLYSKSIREEWLSN